MAARLRALTPGHDPGPGTVAIQLLAGSAFMLAAPASAFPQAFRFFGILLIGTTAVMLLA